MLTPVEMQGRELRQGRGYQRKDVDEFLSEINRDFETLYRENMELKDKVNTLSDGLKYYKDLEKTLQKTLVVAEKTAEETTKVSEKKAALIISDAQLKANQIVQEANSYFDKAQNNIKALIQQYESYRIQCKKLADANLELLNSDAFKVDFEMVGLSIPQFTMPKAEIMHAIDAGEEMKEEAAASDDISSLLDQVLSESSQSQQLESKAESKPADSNQTETKSSDSRIADSKLEDVKLSADTNKSNTNFTKELDTELFEFFNLSDD